MQGFEKNLDLTTVIIGATAGIITSAGIEIFLHNLNKDDTVSPNKEFKQA